MKSASFSVTAASPVAFLGGSFCGAIRRHALGPIVNSLGFDLNRVFNELPIVALILTLTDAGALLIEALVGPTTSNWQAPSSSFDGIHRGLNFFTDLLLSVLDPRIRKSIIR